MHAGAYTLDSWVAPTAVTKAEDAGQSGQLLEHPSFLFLRIMELAMPSSPLREKEWNGRKRTESKGIRWDGMGGNERNRWDLRGLGGKLMHE